MALTRRKDNNYFEKFSIQTTSFDIRARWSFTSIGIALMVESHNVEDVIQYSFDGSTVHGDLSPGFPSAAIVFDNRFENTVYFRRATPGDPVVVRVEAWRHNA
jgi:hypothetical protein